MKTFILATTLLLCLATVAHAEDLTNKTNIALMRDLYEEVNHTRPSIVNAWENETFIRERLDCYAKNPSYAKRIEVCHKQYLKEIVRVSRENIKSRPSLGLFVRNVTLCPVMYNICMAKTEADTERCVLFERQCIDFMLDTYWRGAAQDLPQTYRLK